MLSPCQTATGLQQKSDVELNFEQTDIREVAEQLIGQALGRPYIVDTAVNGTLSFRAVGRMTGDDLLSLFNQALAMNGFTVVARADAIVVTTFAKAREMAPSFRAVTPTSSQSLPPGYSTAAIALGSAKASEITGLLTNLSPRLTVLFTDESRNLILIGGGREDIQAALRIVRLFDDDASADRTHEIVRVENADPEMLTADVTRILERLRINRVEALPLSRLGLIVLVAPDHASMDAAKSWIATLDAPAAARASEWRVYEPKFATASQLLATVNGVLGGDAASTTPDANTQARAPAGFRIAADSAANTLVVKASGEEWPQLKTLLETLDRPPLQVQIEATIVEVTLNDELRYGLNWSIDLGNTGQAIFSDAPSGAVTGRFPGLSVAYAHGDVQAVLNALSAKTDIEVISSPKISAISGQAATLQIGDEVPIVTQTSQSTQSGSAPIVTTLTYRETGVILKVTPRVSGQLITIEISQEVSNVARTTTSGIDSPTFQQRRFESRIAVRSGQTIAIGGLISSNRTRGASGVPVLRDVPVVGALFSSRAQTADRSELLILMTPRVIAQDGSVTATADSLEHGMREIQARGLSAAPK